MKLESQVASLQQAKRLKELGIEQNLSYFAWQGTTEHEPDLESDDGKDYSAFTVAELGQMLPSETYTMRQGSEDSEYANWEWVDDNHNAAFGLFATEAEARAAHLIYLLESDFIDASDCNKRLTHA